MLRVTTFLRAPASAMSEARVMRTRCRLGSKPKSSQARPSLPISAMHSLQACRPSHSKLAQSSESGAVMSRKVASALKPRLPVSPRKSPVRSGP